MDSHAAANPVAVALMVAITFIASLGSVSLADAVHDQAEALQSVTPPAAQTRAHRGAHELALVSGTLDLDGASIVATTDSGTHRVDMSWYTERGILDQQLGTGQWLCVAGPRTDCPLPASTNASIRLENPSHSLSLGQLSIQDDESLLDSIRVTGQRASHYIDLFGGVVLQQPMEVHVEIIGTQITWGSGGPDVPVTARPTVDGGATWIDAFPGPVQRGHVYNLGVLPPWSRIGVDAVAEYSWFHAQYNSLSDDPHVVSLEHGDPVPSAPAYHGQVPVTAMLTPHTSNGSIVLDPNEVILLFEFNPNLSSLAADYQDLVAIITLDPVPLQGLGYSQAPPGIAAQLLCIATMHGPVTVTEYWDDAPDEIALGATPGPCPHEEVNQMDESPADIVLCHRPPGRPEAEHELMVSAFALAAHLHHGDSLGSC